MSKEKQQDKLLSQFHEQYAQNNNAQFSSLITLIVALVAVFAGFGYVFIHSTNYFSKEFLLCYVDNYQFTLDAVVLSATAIFFVLWLIERLCIYQGSQQRKQQFIVHSIRVKYDVDLNLFPKNYHPFEKGINDFIQGPYDELLKVCCVAKIITVLFVIFKAVSNICYYSCGAPIKASAVVEYCLFILVIVITCCSTCCDKHKKYCKYMKIHGEYRIKEQQRIQEQKQQQAQKEVQKEEPKQEQKP